MAEVILRNLVKRFGSVPAVDNVSLQIPDGEFLVLLVRRDVAKVQSSV